MVKAEDGNGVRFGLLPPKPVVPLPPQLLLVVLESGDCVFLFVRPGPDARPEFVAERFASPSPRESLEHPGFHLTVDPISRYIVLSYAQDLFVVYELEAMAELRRRHLYNEPLKPVKRHFLRSVQGAIHTIEFLYPQTGDHRHMDVILLLIVVKDKKSKMVTFDWEVGNDLRTVFAQPRAEHRIPVEYQMPLLIIPLTVQSAFVVISDGEVAVCTGFLHGSPIFEAIGMGSRPPTPNFHGRGEPLWTAWARPFRLAGYFKTRDCIYLAREDGVVLYIEADAESTLDRSTYMDQFNCNTSGAFTCLFDQYADVIIMGSDSGPGGIYKVPARKPLERLGKLPNWTPAVDFVTTDKFSSWNPEISGEKGSKTEPWHYPELRSPDRIFSASGLRNEGYITEHRSGLRAIISLDLEYGAGVKEAWLLPSHHTGSSPGFHLLLSMSAYSTVLHLSEDFSQANNLGPEIVNYDLLSPTLALSCSDPFAVQLTKESVVLLAGGKSDRFLYDDLIPDASPFSGLVSDGCVLGNNIAIAAHRGTQFQIHTFKVDVPRLTLEPGCIFQVDGEITCLSLDMHSTVLAGIWKDARPFLSIQSPQMAQGCFMIDLSEHLSNEDSDYNSTPSVPIEPISSIVSIRGAIILGTRSGEVISVRRAADSFSVLSEKFGMTTAIVTCTHHPNKVEPTVLVSCDKKLVKLATSHLSNGQSDAFQLNSKLQVWPVDISNEGGAAPPVEFGVAVDIPSANRDITPILMVSGKKLLLAEMNDKPSPVPRDIPVNGTPTKLLYSPHLQCLVVAVARDEKTTLMFIDPDSGEDLGRAMDKTGIPTDFISGLGKLGDRIWGLVEWECKKEGNIWRFVLASTRDGRLVVVETKKDQEDGSRVIRYTGKFQVRASEPIYSVVGYGEGLIYCAGNTIKWEVLDTVEKKLKLLKVFDLGSPATSLRISNGKLLALTHRDSLEIIDQNLGTDGTTPLSHVDPRRRNATHMIEAAGVQSEETLGSLIFVSDRDCSVGGLWVPWQVPGKDCESVFEAELPVSVRKFRRGRTRPVWEQGPRHRPKYGRLVNTVDDAEILGNALDGSVRSFTLLNLEIWRILRFIQNVAETSDEMYPFTYRVVDHSQFDPEPRVGKEGEMHVDGDMLRRCFEKRALERLISSPSYESRFAELLDELDDGRHTAGLSADEDGEQYFKLAYGILEYFLRPVL
ncbi:mono-functional DNA-alkylating methyl methanesulfonate N-term-domain-containing protein [Podospora didyma]|uniref:Mono-functional DNA-alkylating methyl methanesulfonate N-term-domain-containing protein n=1 Tax=Podospora didyma TaxID=330526 RepID=A0AAE0U4G7_9PEZI|nr:mono-functional DNA-alkylating methyl methanesulfonate N-term-domain-containing protein [Podospora didyma]